MTDEKRVSLTEKAVLVHFTCNFLGTTKMDKNISEEVKENHKAENPGRYFKKIFRREDVTEMSKAANRSRALCYKYSLPWFDGNVRVMPVALLETFLKENTKIIKDFNTAIDNFIENYDDIMNANKNRLNDMFNKDDYPTKEKARETFGIRIGYMPLPDRDDFRIAAPETIVASMKKQYDDGTKEAEIRSKAEIADRIQNMVKSLLDKLSREDKNVRENAFLRIEPLVNNLRALNITGDPKLEALLKEAEKNFSKETADVVNENSALRTQKKTEAKALLEKVETLKRSLTF